MSSMRQRRQTLCTNTCIHRWHGNRDGCERPQRRHSVVNPSPRSCIAKILMGRWRERRLGGFNSIMQRYVCAKRLWSIQPIYTSLILGVISKSEMKEIYTYPEEEALLQTLLSHVQPVTVGQCFWNAPPLPCPVTHSLHIPFCIVWISQLILCVCCYTSASLKCAHSTTHNRHKTRSNATLGCGLFRTRGIHLFVFGDHLLHKIVQYNWWCTPHRMGSKYRGMTFLQTSLRTECMEILVTILIAFCESSKFITHSTN